MKAIRARLAGLKAPLEDPILSHGIPFSAVSFSGCGALNFYQTGAAAELVERGWCPQLRFAGASAGAGLGVLLAQDSEPEEIAEIAIEILSSHRGKNLLLHPTVLFEFADRFLGHFMRPDTVDKVQGRVSISITKVPKWRNWLVSEFYDQRDLELAVRASSHLPSLRYRSIAFRGERCVDGGFTSNCPVTTTNTLMVSPFGIDRRADVHPPIWTPFWHSVIVPSPRVARRLYDRGKQDMHSKIESLLNGKRLPLRRPAF